MIFQFLGGEFGNNLHLLTSPIPPFINATERAEETADAAQKQGENNANHNCWDQEPGITQRDNAVHSKQKLAKI